MVHQVTLIIGGNQGDRSKLLEDARREVSMLGEVTGVSPVFETTAWGGIATSDFLNQVISLQTSHDPLKFLRLILHVEKILGRTRFQKWGDRLMDIDILYWDDRVIDLPELKVPHPEMTKRRFVLEPLTSLLPDHVHPVLKKTSLELLHACEDPSEVRSVRVETI